MKTKAKQLGKVAVLALSLWYGDVTAQTKTKYESIPISTGHASISVKAKKNGTAMEVHVYNNNSEVSYKISFSANITFRGKKGDFTKSVKYSGKIAPNKNDYTWPVGFGWADPKTNEYFSLIDGEVTNFNATPIEKENTSNTSSNTSYGGSSNNTYTNTISEPAVRYNTNPQVKEAVERQNQQKSLQQKQEEQRKAQEQANYNNAVAYEIQRQQSIKQTHETIEAVTGLVSSIIQLGAEARENRRREEAIRLERENEEYMRKSNIVATINKFPNKDIPLGSKEKAASIYYFIYAYDNTINQIKSAKVYVSNVFEIGTYNDGTRTYNSIVRNEIDKLTPFAEVLHGYYYTLEEAEKLRNNLISSFKNSELSIIEVYYKGKPAPKNIETNMVGTKKEDFWGETKNNQNFAPAKINTAKPSELPRIQHKENTFWD